MMATKIFGILLAGLLAAAAVPYPTQAQDAPRTEARAAAAKPEGAEQVKAKRPLTAHQLKMKECGAKWQEEKKTKGVKGLEAWNKFRSECMKS